MPIVLVTYAQPLSDDVTQSIPQLTEEHDRRIGLMHAFFRENPPVLISLPGIIARDGTESMHADPQAQFLCHLLGISYDSVEQWVSLSMGDQDYCKQSFNATLSRMHKHLESKQLGLVVCSSLVASKYFGREVGPCQMIRFKSTLRQGSPELVLDETVILSGTNPGLDEPTQEVTLEVALAARKQVEAMMSVQATIERGEPLASIDPSGFDLRLISPELAEYVQRDRSQPSTKEQGEKKESPARLALWVIFGLCMAGMIFALIRVNL